MKRLDGALQVRDIIVNAKSAERTWNHYNGTRSLQIKTGDWQASLHTPFNPFKSEEVVTSSYLHALVREQARKPLGNLLDLWVPKLGKLLSLEWPDV